MVSEQLIELLTTKQQELSSRINAIKSDLQKTHSADFSEQATERENDEVLEEIGQEAQLELQQVNRALQRIKDDEFGLCVSCGNDISTERLHVLPYTDFCINCAS